MVVAVQQWNKQIHDLTVLSCSNYVFHFIHVVFLSYRLNRKYTDIQNQARKWQKITAGFSVNFVLLE